jgi:hypothetical protein
VKGSRKNKPLQVSGQVLGFIAEFTALENVFLLSLFAGILPGL